MILPHAPFSDADVERHYDELDAVYREIWGEHVHHGLWVTGKESRQTAVSQLVDVVAAEAEIKAGDKVLDVGSGYGAAARQIALDYGAEVTGITLSRRQHEYAVSHRIADGVPTFLRGDWLRNQFPDAYFDAAYAIESASHMADPQRFVEELVRVVKPGGCVVICAWTASEKVPPAQVEHLLEPICREGRLAHLSTATEYCAMLEKAGMAVAEFRDLSSHVRRTWSIALGRTLSHVATHPSLMRYLLSAESTQRVFPLTMMRLWLAYRAGALRYCLIKARRPRARVHYANLA